MQRCWWLPTPARQHGVTLVELVVVMLLLVLVGQDLLQRQALILEVGLITTHGQAQLIFL